ncbi:Protein of unknown function [Bacillus thuringiensis]|uniref:Uncharacterized protein n=2 Tax=Bacillus cereus group TaxID=86661 RepID=A0A1C4D422_BACTU|nr:Protein of unknown function [Bacillus thuringiensis]SCC36218.1 Protein of unknown function [Bacillus wiedmannii]SCM95808.1 Protein of unknown function [Bacillus cereus]
MVQHECVHGKCQTFSEA